METKILLAGLVGFMLGGLLVSVAASQESTKTPAGSRSMVEMIDALEGTTGDAFDQAFMALMAEHHQDAVKMARLAQAQAVHTELKTLSDEIIRTQEAEIAQMEQWRRAWGYPQPTGHLPH